MKVFEKIKSLLNQENINFTTLQHPPTYTSEQSAEYRGEPLSVGAKAIVYKIEKNLFFLFLDFSVFQKSIVKPYFD